MNDTVRAVIGQLEVWWFAGVTIRLDGLTDDEFLWKPVPDAFCLRSEGDHLFYEWPPGSRGEAVPPVTTIAWRMAHLAQGCFLNRWHNHFGEPVADWASEPFPSTAAGAVEYLDGWKQRWVEALQVAGEEGMWRPLGDSEGNVEIMQLGRDDPFIGLALHINREVMHHGGEICLLRDLYRAQNS